MKFILKSVKVFFMKTKVFSYDLVHVMEFIRKITDSNC